MRTAGKRFERHVYAAAVAVLLQVTLIPSSMAAPAVQDGSTAMYWSSAQVRGTVMRQHQNEERHRINWFTLKASWYKLRSSVRNKMIARGIQF